MPQVVLWRLFRTGKNERYLPTHKWYIFQTNCTCPLRMFLCTIPFYQVFVKSIYWFTTKWQVKKYQRHDGIFFRENWRRNPLPLPQRKVRWQIIPSETSIWLHKSSESFACLFGSDYKKIFEKAQSKSSEQLTLDQFSFFSRSYREVRDIIDRIVRRNDPVSRHVLTADALCSKTVRKYILNLVPIAEQKISKQHPDKVSLILVGWTASRVHFVGVLLVTTQSRATKNHWLPWLLYRKKTT